MPPLLDVRIATLMCSFSQLSPHGQKRFMALLNEYLYASPSQRRRLRLHWEDAVAQPCASEEDHLSGWLPRPAKKA